MGVRWLTGASVLLLVMTTGCRGHHDDAGVSAHREAWQRHAPDSYVFTLTYGSMIGVRSERIHVKQGRVVSTEAVEGIREFLPQTDRALAVDGVFDLVSHDQDHADKVTVTYDDQWGFPASVSVDAIAGAVDDEYGYSIRQFIALSGDLPAPALELISGAGACRDPLLRGARLRRVFFMRLGGIGQAHLRIVDTRGRDLTDPVDVSQGELEPPLHPARGTSAVPAVGRVLVTSGSTVLVDEQHRLTPSGGRC